MNWPISLAPNHVAPPSVVLLLIPSGEPSSRLCPQPPTQPTCSLMKPTPSRSEFFCGSLTSIRFQDCPPLLVFKMAAPSGFSSDTKPIWGVRNWIFQPHSPLGKAMPEFSSRFSQVRPPSAVNSTTGFSIGYLVPPLPPTTQPCRSPVK